jgi:hypothetical protein
LGIEARLNLGESLCSLGDQRMRSETKRGGLQSVAPTLASLMAVMAVMIWALPSLARAEEMPARHRDPGVSSSRAGVFLLPGQWTLETSFEHVENSDFEYDPVDFGFPFPIDALHGGYSADELRLFAGYGLSDRFAIEFEVRGIDATLERSFDDTSGLPPQVSESGLGTARARLNWRWFAQKRHRPELFSYAEVVVPHDEDQPLIGTSDTRVNTGLGVIHEFRWGALMARMGLEYDTGSASELDFHEYAVEYLRRLGTRWQLYVGYVVFEGDEGNLGANLLWSPSPRFTLRLGGRLAIESQALSTNGNSTDWAPEVGFVFRFPRR